MRLRCKARGHEWESEWMETECPVCDESRQMYGRRAWVQRKEWEERRIRMRGGIVSEKERVCENATCGKPLRGYCYREYDEVTGQAYVTCDECGHQHEVQEMDPSEQRMRR